jgi:hypothetical protein
MDALHETLVVGQSTPNKICVYALLLLGPNVSIAPAFLQMLLLTGAHVANVMQIVRTCAGTAILAKIAKRQKTYRPATPRTISAVFSSMSRRRGV